MKVRHTAESLQQLFLNVLEVFNKRLGSEITAENTIIACCTCEECPEIYEQICSEYFPKHLNEPYRQPAFFTMLQPWLSLEKRTMVS